MPKEAQELIAKREEARKAKDWKTADALRQQLKAMGIVIEDTAQGVRWHVEKALANDALAVKVPVVGCVFFSVQLLRKLNLKRG